MRRDFLSSTVNRVSTEGLRQAIVKSKTNLLFRCSRDGDDLLVLSQKPSEGNLTCSGVVFVANILEAVRDFQNVGEVLLGVACDAKSEVALFEVFWSFLFP